MIEPPDVDPPGRLRALALVDEEAGVWYGVFQAAEDDLLGLPSETPVAWATSDDSVRLWELGVFCDRLLDGDPEALALLRAPDDRWAKRCPMVTLLRVMERRFGGDDPPVDYARSLLLQSRHGALGGDRD